MRETSKVSVLEGLKVTSQVEAQADIFPRSAFMQPTAVTGSSTIIKRLVSSANSRIFDPISFIISLIYYRKRRGPRIDPWGSRARMYVQSETAPGRTNTLFPVREIICKPCMNLSCDTSCMKFSKEASMPHTVKGFAYVTEDSPYLG